MLRNTLAKARILIIDDEFANVCLLERSLEMIGATNVRSTTDSSAALALFRDFAPDLVLLDLHMPAPDGFTLLEEFRATETDAAADKPAADAQPAAPAAVHIGALVVPKRVSVPVLVLTADVNPKTKHRALSLGAADFLTKPLDQPEVLLRIRNLLENRFLQLQLHAQNEQLDQLVRERTAQLEDTLTQLKQAQQGAIRHERLSALGTMAAGIAHDFNNALTLIHGYSELLLGVSDDTKTDPSSAKAPARGDIETKYVRTIMMAARDAARTVSRLRAFHRPAGEGDEETRLAVNLNQLVQQAVTLTAPRWRDETQAQGKRVVVRPELGAVRPVLGDPAELREMLTNLIFNAVDALPDGGRIGIRTYLETGGHGGGERVCLDVSDDGVGMDETVRRRCLEPFFTTKGDKGTGLGLSGVYGIVQRHGGALDIDSTPGRGTTFRIVLPAEVPAAEETGDEASEVSRTLRILIVDDQRIVCDLLREQLQHDGHVVQTASSGSEALKKFLAEPFDLLLTDQAMPGMNGEALAAAVKEHAPEVPVILLTGFGDLLEANGATHAGDIDLILHKPVTLYDLRRAIFQTITRADRRDETAEAVDAETAEPMPA